MIRVRRFGALKDRGIYGAGVYTNPASDGSNFSGQLYRSYVGTIDRAILVRKGQSISPDYTMGTAQQYPEEPYSSGINEEIALYFKKSDAKNLENFRRGMLIEPFKMGPGADYDADYEIKSIDIDSSLPNSDFSCKIVAEKRN